MRADIFISRSTRSLFTPQDQEIGDCGWRLGNPQERHQSGLTKPGIPNKNKEARLTINYIGPSLLENF
jgi:hypothetical protein